MSFIRNLTDRDLENCLELGELNICVGPYIYGLQSNVNQVKNGIGALYGDFPTVGQSEFLDFRVAMRQKGLISRWRGEADFLFEHQKLFMPIPQNQAYAFLEWGMNWCISVYANEYLKLHAAVVAKDGRAVIMPGVPGSGKSTLCAALGMAGWRILSDEHALVPPGTADMVPLCRPVSLKNESIDVIRSFSSDAVFGPVCEDTHKGTVAHMKADLHPESHDSTALPATVMLFPRYSNEEPQRLTVRPRTESFVLAAYHAFNYSLMRAAGFEAMKTLVESVECYDLVYRDLDWAIKSVEDLHGGATNR